MRHRRSKLGLGLCALLAAASGASAQTAPQSPATPLLGGVHAFPRPADLSLPPVSLGVTDAQADALRRAGVVRTAIDHHFTRDGVTGSLGFLCGLPPNASDGGATAVRGYDPQGRFLGAKLSFAFR